mgnify:CR=1 FL=1
MNQYIKNLFKKIFNLIKPIIVYLTKIDSRIIRTFIYEVLHHKKILLANTGNEKFLIFTENCIISRHLFLTKEPTDFDKLLKVINNKNLNFNFEALIDIGAHIGTICIPACKRELVSKAIAIEPNPSNFHLLKSNVELNQILHAVETYNCALGPEKNQNLELYLSQTNSGDNRILESKPNSKEFLNKVSVTSETLDHFTKNLAPEKTLVWMDVQGYEAFVLMGSSNTLLRGFPIVFEFSPQLMKENHSFVKLKNILLENKYKTFIDLSDKSMRIKALNENSLNEMYDLYLKKDGFTDIFLIK